MRPERNRNISLIGVPIDLGADRRGVDMGPDAIRSAGVLHKLEQLGYVVHDQGNLTVSRKALEQAATGEKLKYLAETITVNAKLAKMTADEMGRGRFPLALGGDHSMAIGTVKGVLHHIDRLGLLWFDAHCDANTAETTPSGNIHGMPLAVCLGYGHELLTGIGGRKRKIRPENVVIIGARSVDPGERSLLKELGIRVFTMHDIDRRGMERVMEEALERLAKSDGVHLSFDVDGMDPNDAPGVGTPVMGGVTYRESHLAMELLSDSGLLVSAEFVEINPVLDDRNKTAKAAVEMIGSVFGEQIM
ncbi:arginase [Paenibacillus beijingensis]|uniref:Arginase n=1 Tax=Paenibacillus beijingensis TaxID=1126833 RepID=A0A0D5NN98_9BACL|nr:arginase [Paenibacillus beijingensis]AJY76779.1 arginase [Paenibacillus beijingensis]